MIAFVRSSFLCEVKDMGQLQFLKLFSKQNLEGVVPVVRLK